MPPSTNGNVALTVLSLALLPQILSSPSRLRAALYHRQRTKHLGAYDPSIAGNVTFHIHTRATMKSVRVREANRLLCRYSAASRSAIVRPASRHAAADFVPRAHSYRHFHASVRRDVVKPYMLADIGEGTCPTFDIFSFDGLVLTIGSPLGITECQVIQWFVKPGARVEQFDPICEVQSDKASVEVYIKHDR